MGDEIKKQAEESKKQGEERLENAKRIILTAHNPDDSNEEIQNSEVIEQLAAMTKKVVGEEIKALFGQGLGEKILNAKGQIDRKGAVLGLFGGEDKTTGKQKLSKEQMAEVLRVSLVRLTVNQQCTPNPELDVDGVITQALTSTTGSAGGYLLPEEFIAEVEKKEKEPEVVWPMLTKRSTRTRTVIKPEVTTYITPNKGTAAKVNSSVNSDEIAATEPVFSELQWDLEDFDARMPLKIDLVQESPIDVLEELMQLCADGYSIHHEYQPLLGRGHTTYKEPLGLLDATAGITEVAISSAPTLAKILDFCSAIPKRYRSRAKLLMGSDTLYAVIAQLAENVRDASFLMGKIPPMDDSEHVTEGKILGGDFSRYVVYYIRLLQVITSIAAERKTQEIVVTETWTGKPTIEDAFRIGTAVTYD